MSTIGEWWRRVVHRRELEGGLDEEIQFHIDHQIEKNLRLGMSASEARRQAMLRFGGIERAKESTRDEFRPVVLEDVTRDVKYGVRSLARAPGFALVSILTLGLGIGAATAVFSVVWGVLLQPLPYPESDRIVRLLHVDEEGPKKNVSEPNYLDWKERSRSFSAMSEYAWRGKVTITGGAEPYRATVTAVSREFFDVMQVRPVIGRAFAGEELKQNGNPAAVVSDAFWREWLGGRRDFQNLTMRLGNHVFQVVGVMPPGFDYPLKTEIWAPSELDAPQTSRTAHNFRAIARLRDGVTVENAARELSAISRALKAQYGDQTWMTDATVIPLQEEITGAASKTLYMLFGAAAFLLVIACANVSNLLLVRAGTRGRELAVRLAIGASRWRIARQLLVESLVLCVSGGVVGVLLTYWGVRTLVSLQPANLPRVTEVGVNWVVLGFALLISLTLAVVLGVATVLRQNGRNLRASLTEGTRTITAGGGSQRVRDALLVTQVALTLVLLTGAGLLARSFMQVLAVDPGYSVDNALVVNLAMPYPGDGAAGARQTRLQDEIMAQLRRLPGVTAVGGVNDYPLGAGWFANGQFIEMTRPDEITRYEDLGRLGDAEVKRRAGIAGYRVASEEYFKAMGIRVIRGRTFEESDGPDAPHVAVISESLAKSKWPELDPIGRFVQFGNMDGDVRGFRIVGIVTDVRENSLEITPQPLFYGSSRQRVGSASSFNIVVTGTNSPEAMQVAQRIVRQVDPQVPVVVRSAQDLFDQTLAGRRFSLILLGVFSVTALVLATMGLYGLISYVVSQRTREIGIRQALGAEVGDLLRVVVGRGAVLAAVGVAVGLIASLMLGRVVQGMLYGVGATDPVALLSVVGLIGGSVLVASYLPARRALRVAPIITLRSD
jgi:putative ABC transport system permease protein